MNDINSVKTGKYKNDKVPGRFLVHSVSNGALEVMTHVKRGDAGTAQSFSTGQIKANNTKS